MHFASFNWNRLQHRFSHSHKPPDYTATFSDAFIWNNYLFTLIFFICVVVFIHNVYFFSQKTYWIQTKLYFETLRIFSIKNLFYKFLFTYERTYNYTLFQMCLPQQKQKREKNNNKNENTKFIISFNEKITTLCKKKQKYLC